MCYLARFGLFVINITIIMVLSSGMALATITVNINEKTGLKNWVYQEAGLHLKIAQLSLDQVEGFYIARGFPSSIAEQLGQSCMMQLVVKNTDNSEKGSMLSVNLKDWVISRDIDGKKQEQGIKLKETWDAEWADETVSKSARIAFRWGTFPTEQDFAPSGDYNWGVVSFGLPPQTIFDLQIVWYQGTKKKQFLIKNIQCVSSAEEQD